MRCRKIENLVVTSMFWRKSIVLAHFFHYYLLWRSISISWYSLSCACFTLQEICIFPSLLHFRGFLLSNLSAFPCCGLPLRVLSFRCYFGAKIYTTHLSHLVAGSSLFYYVDWGDFVSRGPRIQQKSRITGIQNFIDRYLAKLTNQ